MGKTINCLLYILKEIYKRDKLLIAIIMMNNLAIVVAVLSPIVFPRYIVDQLINGEDFKSVLYFILLFTLTTIISSSISYLLKSSIYLRSMTVRFKLIIESGKKFILMDYENFENPEILDLAERGGAATSDNASGFEGVMHKFANLGGNILVVAMLVSVLSLLNPLIIILIIFLLFFTYYIGSRLNIYEKKVKDEMVIVNRKWDYIINVLNDVAYYKDIFLFNMKNMIFGKIKTLANTRIDYNRRSLNKTEISNNINSLLNSIQELTMYIWFGVLVINERITIGEYLMYMVAVTTFYRTVKSIIDDFLYISLQSKCIHDYKSFLELEMKGDNNNGIEMKGSIHSINFEDVSFSYIGQDNYAVKNINLSIKKNEKIAVVGLNGAGKTTFIKLLIKLYQPTRGNIYFNDINSCEFKRSTIFNLFSVVFQESNLFAFSVAENVSMKPLESTNINDVISTIDSVGLHDTIDGLERKYEHSVLKVIDDKGVDFSGGEIQKLALARALYKNGQIMILDEPTSSYDALSEERIYRQFNDLAKDKTVIFISHRLASTRFCDRIIVFDEGRIVEEGTHEGLLTKNGVYADLFKIQAEQYSQGNIQEEFL